MYLCTYRICSIISFTQIFVFQFIDNQPEKHGSNSIPDQCIVCFCKYLHRGFKWLLSVHVLLSVLNREFEVGWPLLQRSTSTISPPLFRFYICPWQGLHVFLISGATYIYMYVCVCCEYTVITWHLRSTYVCMHVLHAISSDVNGLGCVT